MGSSNGYSREIRERAVRKALELHSEHGWKCAMREWGPRLNHRRPEIMGNRLPAGTVAVYHRRRKDMNLSAELNQCSLRTARRGSGKP